MTDETTGSGGEVVLFPKIKDGADAITPPAERTKKPYDACRHRRKVLLDKEAHQLTCADCGQVLDCFDWIYDYVGRWDTENTLYRQAQQQRRDAGERLAELLRLERNAKARVRKAGVLLTTPQARKVRDSLGGLIRVINRCAHFEGQVTREKIDEWLEYSSVDKNEISALARLLDDAIELRAPAEPEPAEAATA